VDEDTEVGEGALPRWEKELPRWGRAHVKVSMRERRKHEREELVGQATRAKRNRG
jgi:hypothetical protein